MCGVTLSNPSFGGTAGPNLLHSFSFLSHLFSPLRLHVRWAPATLSFSFSFFFGRPIVFVLFYTLILFQFSSPSLTLPQNRIQTRISLHIFSKMTPDSRMLGEAWVTDMLLVQCDMHPLGARRLNMAGDRRLSKLCILRLGHRTPASSKLGCCLVCLVPILLISSPCTLLSTHVSHGL